MTARTVVPGPWWAASLTTDPGNDQTCSVCGAVLQGDEMDVPEPPQAPLCDACARAREFDQTLWEQDLAEPDAGLW